MTISIDATKSALAQTYTDLGKYFGLTTDDPGNDQKPENEPGSGTYYSREASSWSVDGAGVATGTCTVKAAGGVTYTHAILCSGMTGNNMIDHCPIGSVTLTGDGEILLEPTYTQS